MSFVRQSLLLLLLAAVGTYAATEDCDGLNKTLSATNFHKVLGEWVLVWAVSDTAVIRMTNIINSHVHILPKDSSTVLLVETNKYQDNGCIKYNVTMKYPSEEHIVEVINLTMDQNGTIIHVNDSAKAQFFETEENTLVMFYRGFLGRFLFIYRRYGHHVGFQVTKEAEANYHKLAGCLQLSLDNSAIYKEAGDFCHKEYSPERASSGDAGTQ